MQSKATKAVDYLNELPDDRRKAMDTIRKVIKKNIDNGFSEGMQYGMIAWSIPHKTYPAGYHADPKQPVPFLALASQKNHMALYLMFESTLFRAEWTKAGKKLDAGVGCIRFKKLEEVSLEAIAASLKGITPKSHLAWYQGVREKYEAEKAAKQKK
jgi:galactose-1-phosphate uridylyltransferase